MQKYSILFPMDLKIFQRRQLLFVKFQREPWTLIVYTQ
ncbi:hypothetical protein NC651_010658 [Populus alba x Populus x berolinensis]|nr:hypothetical protein NC651_010658 [Populus alba x Populus x berolinensis]